MKIGDTVKFNKCYARKAADRHLFYTDDNQQIKGKQPLKPLKQGELIGTVVGIRWCLMEDYQFHSGNTNWEGDYDPAYACGKPEKVILVTEKINREPYIVRFSDLVL